MHCKITGRPCCIGTQAQCIIASQEYCDFHEGVYHPDKTLCSQVCQKSWNWAYEMLRAIWCHLWSVKNVESTLLLLVKLQTEDCNYTKSSTPHGCFSRLLNCLKRLICKAPINLFHPNVPFLYALKTFLREYRNGILALDWFRRLNKWPGFCIWLEHFPVLSQWKLWKTKR